MTLSFALLAGCAPALTIAPKHQELVAPVSITTQDASPKEDVRMLPAEAYLRTYLQLFGGASPLEVQRRARPGGLFDSWNDYAAALGLPDHRNDLPRSTQTNALMVATFDRLAIALCVRAAEHDLRGDLPPGQRLVFAFDLGKPERAPEPSRDGLQQGKPASARGDAGAPHPATLPAFTPAFDVLHRTFLGYPAALAPAERAAAFFALFQQTVARHEKTKGTLSPVEAGWAAVCLGLARHPEFHTY
jgi:hypothetical protein